jgi:hypothetical protein
LCGQVCTRVWVEFGCLEPAAHSALCGTMLTIPRAGERSPMTSSAVCFVAYSVHRVRENLEYLLVVLDSSLTNPIKFRSVQVA